MEWLKSIAPNLVAYSKNFIESCEQTFQMLLLSGIISFAIGLLLGVILTITKKDGIKPNAVIFHVLDIVVSFFRAIPFLILLIFLIPLTRSVVGTAIGVKGAILPLVFGCVPFFTRQVQAALAGVDPGKVEAAKSMGSGTVGIIFRVYLHEAVPDLIRVTVITAISLIGLTTMAGAVGAGGIGAFAINFGQGLNHTDIIYVCVALLLIIVVLLQGIGDALAKNTTNKTLVNKKYK